MELESSTTDRVRPEGSGTELEWNQKKRPKAEPEGCRIKQGGATRFLSRTSKEFLDRFMVEPVEQIKGTKVEPEDCKISLG